MYIDFQTYVFDYDGVIVDSEKDHWYSYLRASGDDYTFDEYCRKNHAIEGKSLRSIYGPEVMKLKDLYFLEYKLKYIPGFLDFYSLLVNRGKDIYIVTNSASIDTSLFTSATIITGACKPSTLGYKKVMSDPWDTLVFEDSYKGFYAAQCVFGKNQVVYVGQEDYVFYDCIHPVNSIPNFVDILNREFYYRLVPQKIYMSSKTHHSDKWKQLRKQGFAITSSWIDNEKPKESMTTDDKAILCQSFLDDIKVADFGIFYSEPDDTDLFGSLIEFGMLVSLDKPIYIMGHNRFDDEVFYHIQGAQFINGYNVAKNIMRITHGPTLEHEVPQSSPVQKKLDYVVIVASGEGTRLYPLTKHIPKYLVCYNNQSILHHIVNYWKEYTDKFVIVIQSVYNAVTEFYFDLLDVSYEIINVHGTTGRENSYTIHQSLGDKFKGSKLVITWCDIYPVTPIDIPDDRNVIFTYKNFGRYDALSDGTIHKRAFGNIIGIYYFHSFTPLITFEDSMDICDCYIQNFGTFAIQEIQELIDIGDMSKLDSLHHKVPTRYFNTITRTENGLIKMATCSYGEKIIRNEMRFYKFHQLQKPRILNYYDKGFEMEYIHGDTVHNVLKHMTYSEQCKLIQRVLANLSHLHRPVSHIQKAQIEDDIEQEFYTKVDNRLKNVAKVIEHYNFIKSVNGIPLVHSIDHIKKYLFDRIKKRISRDYYSIHGDPHLSNIMLSKDGELCFIDPRGYFGSTKLFGPREYDIGKVAYSLSGFDYFNNDPKFTFYINKNNIDIPVINNLKTFEHLFEDKELNKDMTILHWLGLADYCKTNILKCLSAYYYGIYLYHVKA